MPRPENDMIQSRLIRVALALAIIALLVFIVERLWVFGQYIGGIISTLAATAFLVMIVKPFIDYLRRSIVPQFVVRWARGRYGEKTARRLAVMRLPFPLAVAIVYLVMLFIVFGLVTVAAATIIPQAIDLIQRFPEIASDVASRLSVAWLSAAQRFGLNPDALNQFISAEQLTTQSTQIAGATAAQLVSVAALTAGFISQLFLVTILSLFFVVEDRLLLKQLYAILPRRTHETVHALLGAVGRSFSGYLRGQVVAALIRGAFTIVLLGVFQVNFGIVVAIVYALLSFIPLIGSILGIFIVAVVTLIVRPEATLPVMLILFIFDQFVAYVILPRLMKDTVGVPGIVALLSVSVGVQLLGFWGLIFGVPIVGAIYAVIFDFYLPRRRKAEGLPEQDPELNALMRPKRNGNGKKEETADLTREREDTQTQAQKG